MVTATAVVGAVVLALAGCSSSGGGESGAGATTPSAGPTSHEYLPGLTAFPHVPEGVSTAPVVVMVPGGSWETADPTGLAPLADALAVQGVLAVPVVVRAAVDDVVYPTPVEDVLCALADAAATARSAGIEPDQLVVLGHSSGAHLAALAALDADRMTPECEDPVVAPDALVGLAGPYDIREFSDAASALLDPDADAAVWADANPVLLAARRPELPVLLLHGADDGVVAPRFSTDFAAALRSGGHPTTLTIVPGEDHDGIYTAQVAAGPVASWLADLP